jgi:hypothetical protein
MLTGSLVYADTVPPHLSATGSTVLGSAADSRRPLDRMTQRVFMSVRWFGAARANPRWAHAVP